MALTLAKTKAGLVSGVEIPGKDITVFKGIPFAAPPVGELRWKAPQPVEPWEGVRKADSFAPAAWQFMHRKGSFYDVEWGNEPFECSEDCLYLNVWTPAKSTEEKLPVAVWIYGGGFMSGFAHEREFDGEAFAAKDVIYVSINYRLSIFGYLAHPELDKENERGISGNYGMLDQIAALQWVHDNIEAFGGDPGNVMVFGQSAGAGSTIALFCSPLTKGLINKVVIHSGLGNYGNKEDTYDVGRQFYEHCGSRPIEELRRIPAEEMMEYYRSFEPDFGGRFRLAWGPYVDGYALTESYDDCINNGDYNDVGFLMGSTRDDMAGGAPNPWMPRAINAGMRNLLTKNVEHGRKPGYLYFFSRPLPGDDSGSWHSSELWYIHGTLARCWRPFEKYDYELSDAMITYWTTYMKTGAPAGEGLPEWRPYTEDDQFIMVFGDGEIGQGEPVYEPHPGPDCARWRVPDDPHV